MHYFPKIICELINLEFLESKHSKFAKLPPQIEKLTRLTHLEIEHGVLCELPPELFKLTNLRTLKLNNNEFEYIPPEIDKLNQLTDLDISGNHLTEAPDGLSNLTNLTSLNLSCNKITSIERRLFFNLGELKKLRYLYLEDNSLHSLPVKTLAELPLEYISLTANAPQFGEFLKKHYFPYLFYGMSSNSSQGIVKVCDVLLTVAGHLCFPIDPNLRKIIEISDASELNALAKRIASTKSDICAFISSIPANIKREDIMRVVIWLLALYVVLFYKNSDLPENAQENFTLD